MFSFSAPQVFVGFEIYGFTLDCEDPLIIFESVCNRNQIEQNPEDEAAIQLSSPYKIHDPLTPQREGRNTPFTNPSL
jgi:hypothetical protein